MSSLIRHVLRGVVVLPYDKLHQLCGSMVYWLAHLEFELGDTGSNSGSRHYSRWVATLGKLFTRIASPVSQLQETGVQKGVFGA